jgi:hypothetical protein
VHLGLPAVGALDVGGGSAQAASTGSGHHPDRFNDCRIWGKVIWSRCALVFFKISKIKSIYYFTYVFVKFLCFHYVQVLPRLLVFVASKYPYFASPGLGITNRWPAAVGIGDGKMSPWPNHP